MTPSAASLSIDGVCIALLWKPTLSRQQGCGGSMSLRHERTGRQGWGWIDICDESAADCDAQALTRSSRSRPRLRG